jgi:FMN-dependent NADH-azoreductase
MKRILMIEVSPRGKESASRSVADTLAERIIDLYPSGKLMHRGVAPTGSFSALTATAKRRRRCAAS